MAGGFSKLPTFRNWKFIFSITVPFLLLPIAFLGETHVDLLRFRCAYTILLMGLFWMLEILPLSVTAFFPVFLFPVFGVQSTGAVVANYMTETQMMFIGGISLALGLQYSGLHKRIALKTMIVIGSSPWRLLFGILLTTTLLSCVIVVNTAVAAMMAPIVSGLIEALGDTVDEKRKKRLRIVFMLAVGYGANIGGTATIIGSQSAIIYKELIEKENVSQDGKYMDLNFLTYSAYSMPIAAINMFLMWGVLGAVHLGFNKKSKQKSTKNSSYGSNVSLEESASSDSIEAEGAAMGSKLRVKYSELGSLRFHEIGVLCILSTAIILWFTREPQVFPGWQSLFPPEVDIGDSTVGMAATVLMFIIPQKLKYFRRNYVGAGETLMTWKYLHEFFPWNVIFIVGGGLAISDGAKVSGLSDWLGEQLMGLQVLPKPVILLVLLLTLSVFTEFMSNTATVSLLTPILITLSKELNIHPLYLTLPGSIACQYAFVFPTSNPPNAIVFSAGDMRIMDMAKTGIILNFVCVIVLYFMNLTWGEYVLFNFRDYEYPANVTKMLYL